VGASRGQEPFAAVLGCSDSRVPVEAVFGQGPGQLFVVRVAGNVVTPTQLGSLEFAVVELGTRLIVVMGHTGCGAVAHTLTSVACGDVGDPDGHFGSITEHISRALLQASSGEQGLVVPDPEEAVELNVRHSCAELARLSSILAERLGSGALSVVGAVYDLDSGRVDFVDGTSTAEEPD
jgi:carbonic anhydrase